MRAVVFVVDDEQVIRTAIVKRLIRQGHFATGYDSGEALLQAMLVVSDNLAYNALYELLGAQQRAHGGALDDGHTLRSAFAQATVADPVLRACSQAGLVNNLNDALAWGLAPLYLAAEGASLRQIGVAAAAYPLVWGAGQLVTGWASDHVGRKPLITSGMLVQAVALVVLVAGSGAFAPSLAAAVLLGAGTAMVYPTLIAAVSDVSQPRDRARVVGVYRFWRDVGFAAGALVAGIGADIASPSAAIVVVAMLTAASGGAVAATRWRTAPL